MNNKYIIENNFDIIKNHKCNDLKIDKLNISKICENLQIDEKYN
jgi:hypothetical protein